MKKRFITVCLAALLLASSVSCGGAEKTPETTAETIENTQTEQTEEESAEPEYPAPDLSGLDFGGEVLSVMTPNWGVYSYYMAEELNGESVNDAIYMRSVNTEEALNVDVIVSQEYEADTAYKVLGNTITAGEDAYHIFFTHSIHGVGPLATDHYLYDLQDLPYVNFEAPWWDKEAIDYFTIGEEVYYGRGDILLNDANNILFNKDIAADYQLPDHYDLVREGKWTYDLFLSEVQMVSEDLNGNGIIGPEDKVGYTGDMTEMMSAIPFACGIQLTSAAENGLEFTFWSEKYIEIFDKTYAFFNDRNHCQAYFRSQTPEDDRQLFDEGLALFTISTNSALPTLRDAEMDFGVLPMPKYDEQQEKYRCYAWPCFVCTPISIRNIEKVGAGLEKFAYESLPVTEAYTMDLLRGKSVRDENSIEMLELINDSLAIDISGSYLGFDTNIHKYFYMFYNLISKGDNTVASAYQKNQKIADKVLNHLYDQIIKNQDD